MHADLDHLIRLQQLETAAEAARRTVADEPQHQLDLDAKLAAAQQAVDGERQRLAANQVARRELEKELAVHQGRLSKYKDQLMAVKTNREYQAMQKEIEVAQHEITVHEDRMLERMLEFDEVTAHVKEAEKALVEVRQAIEIERKDLSRRVAEAKVSLEAIAVDRAAVAPLINSNLLVTFERLVRQRGTQAVVEAREGRCSVCQVRVRPQVYNELRRGEILFQCESCQRILYVVAPVTAAAPAPDSPTGT
jgi:predicted  nucleic acid-binding Zn-ribbon protein